jgi:antitoxin HicB
MSKLADYPFEIRPLNAEEGGGFLISFPDFSECISDGETVEEALKNGREALKATIAEGAPCPCRECGRSGIRKIRRPRPENCTRAARYPSQSRRRVPQRTRPNIHRARTRSKREASIIAECGRTLRSIWRAPAGYASLRLQVKSNVKRLETHCGR